MRKIIPVTLLAGGVLAASILLAILTASPAAAHIVLATPQADSGAYYAGFFRVSHGCEGSPTVSIRISIPEGVESAKPQPKPGWTLTVEREDLARPIQGEGGPVTSRVTAITWTGELADDQFDQFGIMMKLPAAAGPLYFPAQQTCRDGARDWVQIPADGQAWGALESPAPVLTLSAPAPDPHAGH